MARFADILQQSAVMNADGVQVRIHLAYCVGLRGAGEMHVCSCAEVFDREIHPHCTVLDVVQRQMRIAFWDYVRCMVSQDYAAKEEMMRRMWDFAVNRMDLQCLNFNNRDICDLTNRVNQELNQYPAARQDLGLF
jgi:hypothetical protein